MDDLSRRDGPFHGVEELDELAADHGVVEDIEGGKQGGGAIIRPVQWVTSPGGSVPAAGHRRRSRRNAVASARPKGVGQKGHRAHRWWLRGERPLGLCDRRFASAYIFAAVCPATGADFALVMPTVNTKAEGRSWTQPPTISISL